MRGGMNATSVIKMEISGQMLSTSYNDHICHGTVVKLVSWQVTVFPTLVLLG